MTNRDRRIVVGHAAGVEPPSVPATPRDGWQGSAQTPYRPNKPTGPLDLQAFAEGGEIWVVASWEPGTLNAAGQVTGWAIETLKSGDTIPFIETPNADQTPPHKIRNLLPNSTYQVSVRALTAQGASSDALTGTVETGHDTTPPPQVSGLEGGAGYKTVTLTWDQFGTALEPFTGKYIVEQATDSGFTQNYVQYDNANSNVATVSNLTTGTTYYFRVFARSGSGVDGAPSATLSFTPGVAQAQNQPSDGIVPTAVTPAPTVTGGPGFFMLRWTPISNNDVVTYELHMSTSSTFTPGAGTLVGEVVGSDQGFVRKTAAGAAIAYDTNYYFLTRTKDKDGYSTGGTSGNGASPITGPVQLVRINTPDIVVGSITAASGIIADLSADIINTGTLNASNVAVTNLNASALVAGSIAADVGYLGNLSAGQITTGTLNASNVSIINLNAGNINTGLLNAGRLGAGTISAVLIELANGGTIRSTNYGTSGGTQGWTIDGAGNFVGNSVVLRGSLITISDALRMEIGSVGTNEITFYTSDAETRGFIQVGNSGYLTIRAPKMSGFYPGEITFLNSLISLDVNGTNLVCKPAETQFFKPPYLVDVQLQGNFPGGAPRIRARSGNSISFDWDGALRFYVDAPSLVKTFVIPHPVHNDRYLVHGTLEGPEAGVYYRGEGQLVDGVAQIRLPDYFEALTHAHGRSVQLTCIADSADDEWCPVLHATYPTDGSFYVGLGSGMMIPDQRFWWEVKAIRKDVEPLLVEPLCSEVDVYGDGPYTYYQKAS